MNPCILANSLFGYAMSHITSYKGRLLARAQRIVGEVAGIKKAIADEFGYSVLV